MKVEIKQFIQKQLSQKQLSQKQIYSVFGITLAVILVCMVVLIVCVANLSGDVRRLEREKEEMRTAFELEKKELSEKVTLLSNQLTVRIEAEQAEAQKKVPSGLPVSGKIITIESEPVIVESEEESETEDQEIPTVVFSVKKETQIVTAGAGVVASIEAVQDGTCIKIDHGNGYVSVYIFKGTPKVKEGDEVLRGTLLFDVTNNNSKFSFQILSENEYINPMDVMEICG